ncbi:hypothetical protein BLOT_004884 [Blomia tropicalis]|nr:hypothetical protein BLOT_004884 [Blomia tropicalis]
MFYWFLGNRSMDQQFPYYSEISEWLRFQPLSILQLDPADRIVLFIAVTMMAFIDAKNVGHKLANKSTRQSFTI